MLREIATVLVVVLGLLVAAVGLVVVLDSALGANDLRVEYLYGHACIVKGELLSQAVWCPR